MLVNTVNKTLEVILEHLGCLYKFHGMLLNSMTFTRKLILFLISLIIDRPVTYLYNTLHFYERRLRDRPPLKKRLVGAVIGALSDIRPPNWALTEQYQLYVQNPDTDTVIWTPELSYYISVMRRFIDSKNKNN